MVMIVIMAAANDRASLDGLDRSQYIRLEK